VITPRQVTVGLGCKRVNVVAAAKHHTVIATELGELFTWGSNRGTVMHFKCIFRQHEPWTHISCSFLPLLILFSP
jgi:inhibitor of Bruton tyrosine kinase